MHKGMCVATILQDTSKPTLHSRHLQKKEVNDAAHITKSMLENTSRDGYVCTSQGLVKSLPTLHIYMQL